MHEPGIPSLSLLACWVASGPIVATVHTAIPRSRVLLVTYPVLRTALEKISGRIAVSEAARTTLVEHIGGDAVVIPNGVATRRYRKAEPLPGWPGTGGSIGFLGRMDEPRKGLAVLLKAFEILGPERPRAAAADRRADRGRRGGAAPGARRAARPGGAARAGQRGRQDPAAALGRRVLLAEHRRRVVRHRDRRGDGGRRADRGQRHRRVPPGAARRRGGGAVHHRRRRATWPAAAGRLLDDPARRAELSAAALAAVAQYDWSVVARDVLRVYETVVLGRTRVAVAQDSGDFA